MKVLHLIDSAGLYGAEKMLLALAEEQAKDNIEPVILSCGLPGEKEKAIETEAKKKGLTIIEWRMESGINIKGIWEIINWAKSENVSIFHSHGYKFNILFFCIPSFLLTTPILTTVHGYVAAKKYSAMWLYQVFDKVCIRKMNAVVFVSHVTKQILANLKKSYVIPNGIPLEKRKNVPIQRFISPNLNLLAIGRLSPEKGFKYLIKAVHDAKLNQRHFTLDILGAGGEESKLKALAHDLNVSDRVKFHGFVDKPEKYFKDFDLLVMPSLTEGLPITLLEAIKDKFPVLASNVGEIPTVLNDIYPVIDATNELNYLYKKIIQFECFYKLKGEKAGNKLYERLIDEYSAVKMQQSYKSIYNNLLEL